MNELSVNISGSERQRIEQKAIELFLKTAKARHPDEDFYKNISKIIVESVLDKFVQFKESPLYGKMNFTSTFGFTNQLSRLYLPNDARIFTLCDDNSRYNGMLYSNRSMFNLDLDDLIIPNECKVNGKILFPFTHYGEDQIIISTEIQYEINDYNEQMKEIYDPLNKQLLALIAVIQQCKTTKAFYAKLPNLTSLFPESLRIKINRKNDTGTEELTEEQKLMQDATNSIATASLLGD